MIVWHRLRFCLIIIWTNVTIVLSLYNALNEFHRVPSIVPILPENDVIIIPDAASPDICATQCLSNPKCLSFLHFPLHQKCWLSCESLPLDNGILSNSKAQFYQKMQDGQAHEYFFFIGIGVINDPQIQLIRSLSVDSYSQCTLSCLWSKEHCVVVTFNALQRLCLLYVPKAGTNKMVKLPLLSETDNNFTYTTARYGEYSYQYSAIYGAVSSPSQVDVIDTGNRSDVELCSQDCLSSKVLCRAFRFNMANQECQLYKNRETPEAQSFSSKNILYFSSKVTPPCNEYSSKQILLGREGFISSPGWPDAYDAPIECKWTIYPPAGKSILVQPFRPQLHKKPDDSCEDKIFINSGMLPCNLDYPVTSFNNKLDVEFKAISRNPDKYSGFHISYKTSWSCNILLNAPIGSIASANYPDPYPNTDCYWNISAPNNTKILLEFVSFHVGTAEGETNKCKFFSEKLVITWKNNFTHKYCGYVIPKVESEGNEVSISFKAIKQNLFQGFLLNYHFSNIQDPTVCNRTIHLTNDQSEVPLNFTGLTSDLSIDCHIQIDSSVNETQILVEFQGFAVGRTQPFLQCFGGYLKAWDGTDETSPLLGHFCGQKIPLLRSTGSMMKMLLHYSQGNTLPSDEKLGFTAIARLVSRENKTNQIERVEFQPENNTIFTPDFSNSPYPHNIHGVWLLQTSNSSLRILLEFKQFQLAAFFPDYPMRDPIDKFITEHVETTICDWDHVTISSVNSLSQPAVIIAQLCGAGSAFYTSSNQPTSLSSREDVFISDTSQLLIELFTNDRWNGPGFNATYQEIYSYPGSVQEMKPTEVLEDGYLHTDSYPEKFSSDSSVLHWKVSSAIHPAAIFYIRRLQWRPRSDIVSRTLQTVSCDSSKVLVFKTDEMPNIMRCGNIDSKDWDEEIYRIHLTLPTRIALSGSVKLLMELQFTDELPFTTTLSTLSTTTETTTQEPTTTIITSEATSPTTTTIQTTTVEPTTPTTIATTIASTTATSTTEPVTSQAMTTESSTISTTETVTTEMTSEELSTESTHNYTPSSLLGESAIYGSAGVGILILLIVCIIIVGMIMRRNRRKMQRLQEEYEPDWQDNSLYRSPDDVMDSRNRRKYPGLSVLFDNSRKSVTINNSTYRRL